MAGIKKKLGEALIESGIIDQEKLDKALELQRETGKRLGEVLVENEFATEEQIMQVLVKQLDIQSVNLNEVTIKQEIIDLLPEAVARKNEVIPIDIINGYLYVAMADPLNYFAIEDIKVATGLSVKPQIALRDRVLESIEKYYGKSRAKEAAQDYKKIYESIEKKDEESLIPKDITNAAPIIKFINTIIENASLNGASDIHIEPEEKEMRVRYRIDGVLREIVRTDKALISPVISRIKIIANLNISETRAPQDGRINFKVREKNIDLRISIVPTIWGEKVVMRILDKSNFSFDLEKMGLSHDDRVKLESISARPYGIMLVAGPTGSGKTTTLYTLLNKLNSPDKNIITIEDPVEYNLKGINQMQVNTAVNFDFANGLRSILRQDPDIVLVGEIRDGETAEISVRAALTGHLVLSTVHTNNAAGTITRLVDMGIEPFLISSTVIGIIAQRLVRRVCPNCAYEYISDPREMKILGIDKPVALKRGKGCNICNESGYKGRTAIFEIMYIDRELSILIDQGASETELEDSAVRRGMKLLRQSCIDKVISGQTTVEEMLRVTYGS